MAKRHGVNYPEEKENLKVYKIISPRNWSTNQNTTTISHPLYCQRVLKMYLTNGG